MIFDRTKLLIGENNLTKLSNSTVAIIGVGGVGGYVAEFLTRAGIGKLILVDFDKIDITNINRQIIATTLNVGKYKVDEFRTRLLSINPNLELITYRERLTTDNVSTIINDKVNYVVDAIDDIPNKVELICYCNERNIPIVSSMGVGNRYKTANYEVCDIYKTEYDKLAKSLRKKLKERGVKHLDVVTSKSETERIEGTTIGSISYLPPKASAEIASLVVNRLLND